MRKRIVKMIGEIQHNIHPMHVYCRVCGILHTRRAKYICIPYESYVYAWMLRPVLKSILYLVQEREVSNAKKKSKEMSSGQQ